MESQLEFNFGKQASANSQEQLEFSFSTSNSRSLGITQTLQPRIQNLARTSRFHRQLERLKKV